MALLETRLFFVAFVDRVDERRIISLRKANNREKMRYAKVSDAT
ncbi:BrnT family toxin [Methylococcus sp. Mc7]|nr:BrnT family toxin [Methylococcus sp. Mc7]